MTDTRTRFVVAATRAFAERGFYGASIAGIAESLGLTKQALLHHFGNKEKLYAEVLARISDRLMADLDEAHTGNDNGLEATFVAFYRAALEHRDDTQLLMRELLDNKHRASSARTWYLKPFLDRLTALAIAAGPRVLEDEPQALAFVYQLLGAINYFAVSEPTLTQMLGPRAYGNTEAAFEAELRALIATRLAAAR